VPLGFPPSTKKGGKGVARVLFIAFVTNVISVLMFVLYRLRQ
jgi:hypothetical protein